MVASKNGKLMAIVVQRATEAVNNKVAGQIQTSSVLTDLIKIKTVKAVVVIIVIAAASETATVQAAEVKADRVDNLVSRTSKADHSKVNSRVIKVLIRNSSAQKQSL